MHKCIRLQINCDQDEDVWIDVSQDTLPEALPINVIGLDYAQRRRHHAAETDQNTFTMIIATMLGKSIQRIRLD